MNEPTPALRCAPMIGIDAVEPERVRKSLERTPRLARRLFHPREIRYCQKQAAPERHLAARFSAKEAVTKALGMSVLRPLDVEVTDGGVNCALVLHGQAARVAEDLGVVVTVSLTHIAPIAAAVALARPIERRDSRAPGHLTARACEPPARRSRDSGQPRDARSW
jgi:holo-[acyl-carrier protein] synthase